MSPICVRDIATAAKRNRGWRKVLTSANSYSEHTTASFISHNQTCFGLRFADQLKTFVDALSRVQMF